MIPLYKPYMPAELPELDNILHSGALSYGRWGRQFEQRLSDYIGVKHAIYINSYCLAWQVLFKTIGLQPGDEVIASPLSCLQSTMPFAAAGLNVVWADIDPRYGVLDPDSVRSKITSRTKLISDYHFCGYPSYIDEINALGREYNILVIDDCIEAFGAKYKGKLLGNVGSPLTIFSFQTVRLPNTIDGGALVIEDDELYQKALVIRDVGINRAIFRDENGEISPACDVAYPSVTGTASDVNAYIGYCQMEVIDELLQKQANNAKRWKKKLFDMPSLIDFIDRPDATPNYWICGILSSSRDVDMKMFREKGYACSSVHLPNTYYSVFGKREMLKGVEEFYNRFIALPSGWWAEL
jgi:dTDP-4-amino-4,6-dideoxygalactose transaminase